LSYRDAAHVKNNPEMQFHRRKIAEEEEDLRKFIKTYYKEQ
jgi:hypothetical protein